MLDRSRGARRAGSLFAACLLAGFVSSCRSSAPAVETAVLAEDARELLAAGETEEARRLTRQWLEREPESADALSLMGETRVREEAWEEALTSFEAALASDPEHVEALYWRVSVLERLERFEEATRAADAYLALVPDDGEMHTTQGLLLDMLFRSEEAVASYRRALEHDPWDTDALEMLAFGLYDLDRYEEAAPVLTQWIESLPPGSWDERVDAEDARADCWLALGHALEAHDACTALLLQDPELTAIRFQRARALNDLDRKEEALEEYARVAEEAPDTYMLAYNQGVTLGELGRFEEAQAAFERAVREAPDVSWTWGNLGWTLVELQRFEEAEAPLRRSLELAPENPIAYTLLGVSHLNRSQPQEALAAFDAALAIEDDFAGNHYNRALALSELGRTDEVEAALEACLDLYPTHLGAKQMLAGLRTED